MNFFTEVLTIEVKGVDPSNLGIMIPRTLELGPER